MVRKIFVLQDMAFQKVWWLVFFLFFALSAGQAAQVEAQVVDRVELVPTADAVEIQVIFNTPVVYQYYLPEKKRSDFIQVHLVLPDVNAGTRLVRERNPSPPSDFLPRFTVIFPNQETRQTKSLALRFDQPVPFEVKGTKGRNTVVIRIPITTGSSLPLQDAVPPAKQKTGRNQDILPPRQKAIGGIQQPPAKDTVKNLVAPKHPNSILDHIDVTSANGKAEIHLMFKSPVRYFYHFPLDPGNYVRIHLVFPELPKHLGTGVEHWTGPPSDIISPFTVDFLDEETNLTKRLTIHFQESIAYSIRAQEDGMGVVVSVPKNTPTGGDVPTVSLPESGGQTVPPPLSPMEQNFQTRAGKLMEEGRAALTDGHNQKATQLFNAVLMLPPNSYSEDAQELVGLARERSGEIDKARIEYEVFLKLYPNSEGAGRVRQRLAALPQMIPQGGSPKALKQTRGQGMNDFSVFGNVTQYYFGGHSRIQSTTINGNAVTTTNQSTTDQSSVVSSFNMTGRQRYNQFDTQLIVRGTDTMDFLQDGGKAHQQRLRRAYITHGNTDLAYLLQLGRQPGNSGGIFGTFDGGWARYDVIPQVGLNLVGGFPEQVSTNADLKIDTTRYFMGTNVDLHPVDSNWSANTYVMNQMVSGIIDRQAAGGDFRYFENGHSVFSLVDYDLSYRVINIAMLNGSWLTDWGFTVNFLLDHRKTPSMQTTNALIGNGAGSIKQALASVSEDELRRQAKGVTADSNLFLLGLTHPLTDSWQVGGEVRMNYTTATEAVGGQPSIPASGDIWTYTLQATATDLFIQNHTLTIIGNYIDNPAYQGESLFLTSFVQIEDRWQINSSLNVYFQNDQAGTEQVRITPAFRVSYRLHDNVMFEVEAGIEQSNTNSSTQRDSMLRDFFSFGYIWQR